MVESLVHHILGLGGIEIYYHDISWEKYHDITNYHDILSYFDRCSTSYETTPTYTGDIIYSNMNGCTKIHVHGINHFFELYMEI